MDKKLHIRTDALGRVYTKEVHWLISGDQRKLRRMIAAGEFPPPLPGRRRGEKDMWRLAEVRAWAEAQVGYAW